MKTNMVTTRRTAIRRRQPRKRRSYSSFISSFVRECIQEAWIVINRSVLSTVALVLVAGALSPLYAQDAAAGTTTPEIAKWSIITAGFALAFAAGLAALAQGRAVSSATEAIARNPGAAGDIRGALLLGLVLIESLAIYGLVISLVLLFVKPF